MKAPAAYLKITSWKGRSLGATHYYGKLCCGDTRVELKKTLTEAQAERLNQQHGDGSLYEAGHEYSGFDSKNEVVAAGRAAWKQCFPDATVLVQGSAARAEPQLILEGPPELKERVNQMHHLAEAIGWYDRGQEERMEQISDEFWELWQPYR